MTEEQKATPVEVMPPEGDSLVKQDSQPEVNVITEETQKLIDAIRTKAQSEATKAGEMTRDKYLEAVRAARQEIEKFNLDEIKFDKESIEEAIKQIQSESEKNWENVLKQVTDIGDRINEAAKAAWEKLTEPRKDEESSDS